MAVASVLRWRPFAGRILHSLLAPGQKTWLVLLLFGAQTGTVLRYFEDELAEIVALSFFRSPT